MSSKGTAKCFYCGIFMRRDNLQRHTERLHHGKTVKEAMEKGQQHLTLPSSSKSSSSISPLQSQNNACDTDSNMQLWTKKNHYKRSRTESESSELEIANDCIEINSMELEPKTDETIKSKVSEGSTDQKLNHLIEMMESMKVEIKEKYFAAIPESSTRESGENLENDIREKCSAISTLVRLSASIEAIINICDTFEIRLSDNIVQCLLCESHYLGSGTLAYDFSLGTTFANREKQPRGFLNFKKKVVTHLQSNTHLKLAEKAEKLEQLEDKKASRNFTVGLNLARNVYKLIKTGSSQLQYELEVLLDNEKGLPVGELQHSRKFAASLTKDIAAVIAKRLLVLMNEPIPATKRPPPFSVIGDKLTPNRQTCQIVGIVTFLTNQIQALFLDMAVVKGHKGEQIAAAILDCLLKFGFNIDMLCRQMVGGAFDGQYFHLNVDEHLRKLLLKGDIGLVKSMDNDSPSISEELVDSIDDRVFADCHWHSFTWDPAHRLELAEGDARNTKKNKNSKWICNLKTTISTINKEYSYGKSLQGLLDHAADRGNLNVKLPKTFSNTRFVTYSCLIFKSFRDNYPLHYDLLNESHDDNLDLINNTDFILHLEAALDIYTVLSKLSLTIQKVELTPWEIGDIVRDAIDKLDRMIEITQQLEPLDKVQDDKNFETVFPNLNKAMTSLKESGTYQGFPILLKQHFPGGTETRAKRSTVRPGIIFSESFSGPVEHVNSFLQRLKFNIFDRFFPESKLIEQMRNVFDMRNLEKSDESQFQSLAYLIDLANSESNQNLDSEATTDQFRIWRQRALTETAKILSTGKQLRKEQLKILYMFFEKPAMYEGIHDFLHLLLCCMVKTHCEAVVESMGSIANFHTKGRGPIEPATVASEIAIHWQGPPPNKYCTPLLLQALDLHFGGRRNWRFYRTTERADMLKFHKVSEVVDRLAKEKPKFYF